VVERISSSGGTIWGHAFAALTDEESPAIVFEVDSDDETTGFLTFHSSGDGQLSGTWVPTISGVSENWEATVNDARNAIAGTWHSLTGDQTATFYRAQRPDSTVTGLWTRLTDDVATVVAYDGQSLLVSPLGDSGYWTEQEQIDFLEEDSDQEQLFGVGGEAADHYTGLIFAQGTRILLQFSGDTGVAWIPFERSLSQSDLNGRWVVGDRESRELATQRAVGVVIAYHDTLYIHEAYDGGSGLGRSLRAVRQGAEYIDDEAGWSGRLNEEGNRIIGQWIGYPDWYHSMDRTARPSANDLTGQSRSFSIDWTGLPPHTPVAGTATITQTGDRLQITDQSGDGSTYQVDATWVGDHYSGTYTSGDQPQNTFPWRGEMVVGGWYIHGAWNRGEYSFLQATVADTADSLTTLSTRTLALVADPYQDLAATFNDPDAGTAVTLYRNQDRVSGFTYTTPDGTLQTTLDERLRPTRAVGLGHVMTIVWSEDSSSAEVTVEHDGASTTVNAEIDLTDEGLLRAVDANEDRTGQDMTAWRNWIAANPGLVLAVARGEQLPPSLGGVPTVASSPGKTWAGAKVNEQVVNTFQKTALVSTGIGAALMGDVVFAAVLVGEEAVFASAAGAIALGASAALLGLAAVIMIAILLYVYIEDCRGQPCSLRCFFNCL
jgi:hypothetical protein